MSTSLVDFNLILVLNKHNTKLQWAALWKIIKRHFGLLWPKFFREPSYYFLLFVLFYWRENSPKWQGHILWLWLIPIYTVYFIFKYCYICIIKKLYKKQKNAHKKDERMWPIAQANRLQNKEEWFLRTVQITLVAKGKVSR